MTGPDGDDRRIFSSLNPGVFWVPAYPGRVVLRIKSTKHVFKNFAFRVISFNVFWKFLRLENTAWNFFRS